MSFILDALKKSEIERQRQSMPGLMDAPAGARRSRLPRWAIGLGALLTINIVVLAVVLMRNAAPNAAAPGAAVPSSGATAAAAKDATPPGKRADTSASTEAKAPAADHFSPLDSAPVYAPEIPVPPAEEPSAAPRTTFAQRSAPRAFRKPDPVLIDESPADNEELLPSVSEINLQELPELHLDVHVYATKPSDRFVYINMRKYHEGNTLQEGPVLERIRRDGVVLDYQGVRFVLPRQS
jgi:general secretion pathway protein B